MTNKREGKLLAAIFLLSALLLAALGVCGYQYNKIATLEKLARDHQIEMAVVKGNLETAKANLETANEKIKKYGENEKALLKRIKEIEEKHQEKLDKKSANRGNVKQAKASTSAKKKHIIVATQSKKKVAIATPTIKTVHKAKPAKKTKPGQIKKAGHGKKHAHVISDKVNNKKPYKRTAKRQHGKIEKSRLNTKTMSLTALCEAGGSDAPFFKNLLRDTTTYGYNAQAWEEEDGSVKRVKILLTGPEMPNVQ